MNGKSNVLAKPPRNSYCTVYRSIFFDEIFNELACLSPKNSTSRSHASPFNLNLQVRSKHVYKRKRDNIEMLNNTLFNSVR